MTERYPIIVEPLSDADGGGYLATAPDLPGCMGDGDTPEAATRDLRAAMEGWIAAAQALGRTAPAPHKATGQWRQRVPKSLHAKLTAAARADGVSLNAFVSAVLAREMGRRDPGGDRA